MWWTIFFFLLFSSWIYFSFVSVVLSVQLYLWKLIFFSSGENFLSFFVKLLICPTRWRAKKKVWLLLSTNQFYRIWTREREKKKSSQRVMGLVLYAQNNASCNQLPHRLNQQFKSNTNIWISFGCKGTKLCLFWFFFLFILGVFLFCYPTKHG